MARTARTAWKGSLSFGLVNVPVGLYPATEDRSIHFNQFEEGTSDRIRYRKVNERTGQEVDAARIARGVAVGGDEYVVLTDGDLQAAAPEKSKNIEITGFVDLEEIDPLYYRASYYLAPDNEAAGKAYALLRRALSEANKVGIATMVMRTKEYLVAVRPDQEVLMLETMYFADEVRSPAELPNLPSDQGVSDKEVEMAKLLVDAMATRWEAEAYYDTYRDQVQALVDQKLEGREVVTEADPPAGHAEVIDLMEALNASVRRAGGEGGRRPAKKAATQKAGSAKKSGTQRQPARTSSHKAS
jgi:DNA end-binding protein Ku